MLMPTSMNIYSKAESNMLMTLNWIRAYVRN
jgi:hypothetical protein